MLPSGQQDCLAINSKPIQLLIALLMHWIKKYGCRDAMQPDSLATSNGGYDAHRPQLKLAFILTALQADLHQTENSAPGLSENTLYFLQPCSIVGSGLIVALSSRCPGPIGHSLRMRFA